MAYTKETLVINNPSGQLLKVIEKLQFQPFNEEENRYAKHIR